MPYRIAALSSFTSYSIGHNIGATVFTGGAIRFRIYSDYGLNAIDVAKICFLSGLTFWLGNLFVLGIGMAYHPAAASAMDLLPPAMNRLIALGCLAGIVAYFVWLMMGKNRRELGQNGWKVVLPSARLTLVQILIGVVDLGFCAMAMYLLMPAAAADRFHVAGGGVHSGDPARLRQPCAGQSRRVRCGDAGGAAAVRTGAAARDAAGVPRAVFRDSRSRIAISIMGIRELWLNVVVPWQAAPPRRTTGLRRRAPPQPRLPRQLRFHSAGRRKGSVQG